MLILSAAVSSQWLRRIMTYEAISISGVSNSTMFR